MGYFSMAMLNNQRVSIFSLGGATSGDSQIEVIACLRLTDLASSLAPIKQVALPISKWVIDHDIPIIIHLLTT